jgi:kinesin family protein 11
LDVCDQCRPLNEEELRINTPVVITCNEQRREVSAAQNIANKQIDRTFVFDKVYRFSTGTVSTSFTSNRLASV